MFAVCLWKHTLAIVLPEQIGRNRSDRPWSIKELLGYSLGKYLGCGPERLIGDCVKVACVFVAVAASWSLVYRGASAPQVGGNHAARDQFWTGVGQSRRLETGEMDLAVDQLSRDAQREASRRMLTKHTSRCDWLALCHVIRHHFFYMKEHDHINILQTYRQTQRTKESP